MQAQSDANKIDRFLQNLLRTSGLKLTYRLSESGTAADSVVFVEFSGPDAPMLLEHEGELLLSLEHIAGKVLRLASANRNRLSFDSCHFKANRDELWQAAASVPSRGNPLHPMNSHS